MAASESTQAAQLGLHTPYPAQSLRQQMAAFLQVCLPRQGQVQELTYHSNSSRRYFQESHSSRCRQHNVST